MLEAMDRDKWDGLPTRWYRQKGPYDTTTLAMHWDRTYRDRLLHSPNFWEEEPTWPYQMAAARDIARHMI